MAKSPAAAAAAKPDEEKAEAARKVRALSENRLKLVLASAADVGNQFAAVTPIGTPFEDVLEPEFWAHTAYKLRPGDQITVHTDDMAYYGLLYVRDVSTPGVGKLANRAIVAGLGKAEFGAIERGGRTSKYEVAFLGPHEKWCVRAIGDQRVVKSGCGTQEEAYTWIRTQAP